MRTKVYPIFRNHAYGIDLTAEGSLGLLLVTAVYRYSDRHEYRGDIRGEVQGEGYDAGGKAIQGCRFVPAGGDAEKLVCGEPVVWTRATFREAAVGAVLYHRRGGEADADELLAYFAFTGEHLMPDKGHVVAVDFPDGLLLLGQP